MSNFRNLLHQVYSKSACLGIFQRKIGEEAKEAASKNRLAFSLNDPSSSSDGLPMSCKTKSKTFLKLYKKVRSWEEKKKVLLYYLHNQINLVNIIFTGEKRFAVHQFQENAANGPNIYRCGIRRRV